MRNRRGNPEKHPNRTDRTQTVPNNGMTVSKTPNSADIQLLDLYIRSLERSAREEHEVAAIKGHVAAMRNLIGRLLKPIYGDDPATFSESDADLLRAVRDELLASVPSRESLAKMAETEQWNARQRANVAAACERLAEVIAET